MIWGKQKGVLDKSEPTMQFFKVLPVIKQSLLQERGFEREVHQELFSVGVTFIFEISVVIRMALK